MLAIKKYLLTISLLVAITHLAHSQNTAQAVMKVSVNVINGVSATSQPEQQITIFSQESIPSTQIGTISLAGSSHRDLLVTADRDLELINKKGEQLQLLVDIQRVEDSKSLNLYFGYDLGTQKQNTEAISGNYTGTLTTKIEYL